MIDSDALDLFRGVIPFVVVAEERSFRQAARRLGVSAAAISKSVQTLEAELGLSLLARTTRAVSLTREGERFFERCREAVATMRGAREAIEASKREPAGGLVVTAPFVAMPLLAPALVLLRSRYPRLRFDVRLADTLARLVEEKVDVAVRIGPLTGKSLIARKLRGTRLITVAAPSYLARKGRLERAEDLGAHDALVLRAPGGQPRPFLFASGVREVRSVLLLDHGPSLIDAALAGLGVTQLFDFMAEDALRAGTLVRVLEDDVAQGPDVQAVCAPGRRASPNVRAAFHALADAVAAG